MAEPTMTRKLIILAGRQRIGKTTIGAAMVEEALRLDHPFAAWDLDRLGKETLSEFVHASRPTDSSDSARAARLEDAIHETMGGTSHALVDAHGDDILIHLIEDKLPEMSDLFAEAGLETIAVHVLGSAQKDLTYFQAVRGRGTYSREIIVLNYGALAGESDPEDAFAAVRKAIGTQFPIFVVRKLPPKIISAMKGRKDRKVTLWDIATGKDMARGKASVQALDEAPVLKYVDCMVLKMWLERCIGPILSNLMNDPAAPDLEAAE